MLKRLLLLLVFSASVVLAQTTTVTGSVTDANGNAYFPGTVSAYINLVSGQPLPPGVPASGSIGPFPITAGGNFVVIVASPFTWIFTICGTPPDIGPRGNPNVKPVCFNTPAIPISGLSESITPFLGPIPLIGPGGGGGGGGAVSSVFGRAGAVTAVTNDYSFSQIAGTIACPQTPALTGDTTSPAGSCVTTTSALNGVLLGGLPTGILKNLTGTGTPSIAISNDITGLWGGSCSSLTFLAGDGQCRTPPGSGTVTNTAGPLTAGDFMFGNGGVDSKDSGFSIVPAANGGSGVANPTAHGIPFAEGSAPFNIGCTAALTGQLLTANNAADPTCNSPGIGGGDLNTATYTVKCDSGTTLVDRATIIRFITQSPTVTMPDPTAAGCGSHFIVGFVASGVTITVNRTTTAVFNIYGRPGDPTTSATTFTLTTNQYAIISSPDNANWLVRVTSGNSAGTVTHTVGALTALTAMEGNGGADSQVNTASIINNNPGPFVVGTAPDEVFEHPAANTIAVADVDANGNITSTERALSRTQCVNITPVTLPGTSTTADQNLQFCKLDANLMNLVGRTLKVSIKGVYTTPAANASTLQLKVKLCTVSGCGSGTVIAPINITTGANAGGVTNDPFVAEAEITTQTAGATSAYEASGSVAADLLASATGAASFYPDTNTATIGSIDSTGAIFLQVTLAFSVASASNIATERKLTVEVLN